MARKPVGLQNRIPRADIAAEAATHARILNETVQGDEMGDLSLSGIEFRDPRDLKPSPHNEVFESLKDPTYWTNLRRDIEEAGTITDPLLILRDGEILSGHSRQRVAVELLQAGRREFEKIPVRVVITDLDEAERKKRVYLGNLSRFEIDPDTRLVLYAAIYPDYFDRAGTGRPGKGVTVTRSSVAQTMGVSEETAKKEKAIYQEAKKAKGEGPVSREDVAAARKTKNASRRKADPPTDKQQANSSEPDGPDVFGTDLRQRFDLLRDEVEAAFVVAVKKAVAMERPAEYLDGIEAVAMELQGTVSVRKVLNLIKNTRGENEN